MRQLTYKDSPAIGQILASKHVEEMAATSLITQSHNTTHTVLRNTRTEKSSKPVVFIEMYWGLATKVCRQHQHVSGVAQPPEYLPPEHEKSVMTQALCTFSPPV